MQENRLTLHEMAWALEEGRVLDGHTGETFKWTPAVQILPLRTAREESFQRQEYLAAIEEAARSRKFSLKEE